MTATMPGGVRPLVALEERLLGRGRDLAGVLRILLRDALRAGERLRELALDAVVDLSLFGAAAIAAAAAVAYPAVSRAPKIDCMIAPPRSRWRSAVPDAIPARRTGTEPVSECDAGVPANPTPIPMNT